MSFEENLQFYRKKKEITQEQLAEMLGVSRQTISKWEAGASFPEMEKILQLCDMFGCSMDLLLRGNAEECAKEDTTGYDRQMNRYGRSIVAGIAILLLSVTLQMVLSAVQFDEDLSTAIFMLLVIPAVLILVVTGMQQERYQKKYPVIQPFYSEEVLENFERRFPIMVAAGIGTILAGVVFVLVSERLPVPEGFTDDIYIAVFLLFVTIGVCLIIYAGMQKEKYDIEEYNKSKAPDKRQIKINRLVSTWCACIMMFSAALYLIGGLVYNLWSRAWIVFPVGGILCGIAVMIIKNTTKDEEN